MKIVVGYFSDCATVLKIYMKKIIVFILFLCIVNVAYTQQATESISEPQFIEDKGFWQEYHEAYPVSINPIENNVRSIAVDKKLTVWIATEAGIFMKKNEETKWIAIPFQDADKGPAFAIAIDEHDAVWMGTWKGVFVYKNNLPLQFVGPHGPVSIICTAKEGVYALGPKGVWLFNGNSFVQKDYSIEVSRGQIHIVYGGYDSESFRRVELGNEVQNFCLPCNIELLCRFVQEKHLRFLS